MGPFLGPFFGPILGPFYCIAFSVQTGPASVREKSPDFRAPPVPGKLDTRFSLPVTFTSRLGIARTNEDFRLDKGINRIPRLLITQAAPAFDPSPSKRERQRSRIM